MAKVTDGIVGLLASRKGTLVLLIVVGSFAALFSKHLDGTSFAAVIATVSSIWCAAHAYQNSGSRMP